MIPQYIYINEDGDKTYYKNKEMTILHREDGPAVEWSDEWSDDYKAWYINGKRHREDGPAIVWGSDNKSWYLNGECLSEQEFLLKTAKEIVLTMDEIAAKFGIEVSKLKISK